MEAVTRYLLESQHKRSLEDDKTYLRWVSPYLKGYLLSQIARETLDNIAKKKQSYANQSENGNGLIARL
jgi:hypothetical protein